MITHTWRGENKNCLQIIFTHIARCGGSTIENWIAGNDYWVINPNEKHIPAVVQKKLYEPYWKDYFKFTIVRNPFDRFRSLWKYASDYGLTLNSRGEIECDEYKKRWNYPKCIEYSRNAPIQLVNPENLDLKEGSLYSNMLLPEVKVFRFEDFSIITRYLETEFGLTYSDIYRRENSMSINPPLSKKTIRFIQEIHDKDFDTFDYSRNYK